MVLFRDELEFSTSLQLLGELDARCEMIQVIVGPSFGGVELGQYPRLVGRFHAHRPCLAHV